MATKKIEQLSQQELLAITGATGAQYLVADGNGIISERNAGFADVSSKIPVNSTATFNAFSVTKTATAAALLKLVEQNRIALADFVNPLFNEFHFEYPFTLQQLLSHQAGFADPVPISWIHLPEEEASFDANRFIRQIVDKHSRQKFKPGTRFSYSSIGYLLLSQIIEKISVEPFDDYVRKNIIPALSNEAQLDFVIHDESKHAVGYHPRFSFSNLLLSFFLDRKKFVRGNFGSWMAFNNFYVNGKGYGGFIGNVRGLASYLQSYLNNQLFANPETQQLMFEEQKGGMALGWFTGKLNREKYVCHAGGGGGYYCEIRIYPDLKIASALLRNKSSFSDLRLLDKMDSKTIFNNNKIEK